MKTEIQRRSPHGFLDYLSLAVSTFGVGYFPIAPGTWGSAVGVVVYLFVVWAVGAASIALFGTDGHATDAFYADARAILCLALLAFSLFGIWAANRANDLQGNSDPSQTVVDEVMGQLITFLFIPFTFSWKLILAGFLLFRLFDIWKPYPIDSLQSLPGGVGVCADDIVAGVYAGVVLMVIYAISWWV